MSRARWGAETERAVAREMLAELARLAQDERENFAAGRGSAASSPLVVSGSEEERNGAFARVLLARFVGSLEARLPRSEWNRVDVTRLGGSR